MAIRSGKIRFYEAKTALWASNLGETKRDPKITNVTPLEMPKYQLHSSSPAGTCEKKISTQIANRSDWIKMWPWRRFCYIVALFLDSAVAQRAATVIDTHLIDGSTVGDLVINDVAIKAIGPNGHAVAEVRFSGEDVTDTNNWGLLLQGDDGQFEIVAREGEPFSAPGLPVGSALEECDPLEPPLEIVNDTGGALLFECFENLSTNQSHPSGILHGKPGVVSVLAWYDQELENGKTILGLSDARMNRSGLVAFKAERIGVGDWISLGLPGAIQDVVVEGTEYPSVPDGGVFATIGAPFLSNAGDVVFPASLQLRRDRERDTGVWLRKTDGEFVTLVREDDAAAGIEGAVYSNQYPLSLADGGWLGLGGRIRGDVVDANDDDYCAWISNWNTGEFNLVARGAGMAPAGAGRPPTPFRNAGTFSSDAFDLGVAANGRAVLTGTLDSSAPGVTSSSNEGIWFWNGNALSLIAREGDQVPGFPGNTYSRFDNVTINPNGRVAYSARVSGNEGGDGESLWRSVWATDSEGVPHLVSKTGDTLTIDGATHLVSSCDIPSYRAIENGGGGGKTVFSATNQLPVNFVFENGASGAVVFTVEHPLQGLTFAEWKASIFDPEELADPGITGDQVDLDRDNLDTVLEYITAGDPHVSDPNNIPRIEWDEVDGQMTPILVVRVSTTLSGDDEVVIQRSTDLNTWTTFLKLGASGPDPNAPADLEIVNASTFREVRLRVLDDDAWYFRLAINPD